MNKSGPIILIDDDPDDQYLFQSCFDKLGYPNKVIIFNSGDEALTYLHTLEDKPFLIVSDINMPKMNGLELRQKIFQHPVLREKCMPYIFFTTGTSGDTVKDAYAMAVQGLFIKPNTSSALEQVLKNIIDYWKNSVSPD